MTRSCPPQRAVAELRDRDAWNLTHYMYGDLSKASGRVRIPIDRAMELYAQEAGRASFYPAKATAPKKDDACRPLTPKS